MLHSNSIGLLILMLGVGLSAVSPAAAPPRPQQTPSASPSAPPEVSAPARTPAPTVTKLPYGTGSLEKIEPAPPSALPDTFLPPENELVESGSPRGPSKPSVCGPRGCTTFDLSSSRSLPGFFPRLLPGTGIGAMPGISFPGMSFSGMGGMTLGGSMGGGCATGTCRPMPGPLFSGMGFPSMGGFTVGAPMRGMPTGGCATGHCAMPTSPFQKTEAYPGGGCDGKCCGEGCVPGDSRPEFEKDGAPPGELVPMSETKRQTPVGKAPTLNVDGKSVPIALVEVAKKCVALTRSDPFEAVRRKQVKLSGEGIRSEQDAELWVDLTGDNEKSKSKLALLVLPQTYCEARKSLDPVPSLCSKQAAKDTIPPAHRGSDRDFLPLLTESASPCVYGVGWLFGKVFVRRVNRLLGTKENPELASAARRSSRDH